MALPVEPRPAHRGVLISRESITLAAPDHNHMAVSQEWSDGVHVCKHRIPRTYIVLAGTRAVDHISQVLPYVIYVINPMHYSASSAQCSTTYVINPFMLRHKSQMFHLHIDRGICSVVTS
eukprot:scaffold55920_cov88-Cyclotella_meneghiniana.AAC.3